MNDAMKRWTHFNIVMIALRSSAESVAFVNLVVIVLLCIFDGHTTSRNLAEVARLAGR